jgi:hypothetical protein
MNPSLEAVAFQGGSKLAIALIEIFQEVINHRDSLTKTSEEYKFDTVTFFHNVSVKKMIDAINKTTGLVVPKIIVSKYPNMAFECRMFVADDVALGDSISRFSGLGFDPHAYIDPKDPYGTPFKSEEEIKESLKNISKLLDVSSSKLSPKADKKYPDMSVVILFDPWTAFLSKECYTTQVDYLTAAEIAAILIHEVGHMISAVEYGGDLIRRHDRLLQLTSVDNKKVSNKILLDRLSALKEGLSKTGRIEETNNSLLIAENSTDQNNSMVSEFFATVAGAPAVALNAIQAMLGGLLCRLMYTALGPDTGSTISGDFYVNKSSDFLTTDASNKICERYADEFTVRHGLAAALISGLEKTNKIEEGASISSNIDIVRKSSINFHINTIVTRLSVILAGRSTVNGGLTYESNIMRSERNLQNLIKIFKHEGLSDEVMNFYLDEVVKCENLIRKLKSSREFYESVDRFAIIAQTFLSVGGLINILKHGMMDQSYTKLLNAIEATSSNKLFIRSAQLNQLSQ